MNHMAIAGLGIIVMALLLCAGCMEEQPPAPPLEGTSWKMARYVGADQNLTAAIEGTEVTAYFGEDGSLQGSGGCNSYQSSYETDGHSLTIAVPITTLMYCSEPEGVMEQESAFFTALGVTSSYDIQDGSLVLMNEAGETVLVLSPLPNPLPVDLQERTWQLMSYSDGRGGIVSVLRDTEITAVFGDDYAISGNAGCNHYGGPYELNGEEISIGPLFMTEMYCAEPEGVMAQESAYLAAIETARTWNIAAGKLTLFDDAGAIRCVYSMGAFTDRYYLTERGWLLTRYLDHNGSLVSVASPGTQTTAVFAKNGTLSGNAGCNQYHAAYETVGTSIAIGPLASTRMMCAEAIMEQEDAYLLNLGNASTFDVSDGTLTVMDNSGSVVLEFEPA